MLSIGQQPISWRVRGCVRDNAAAMVLGFEVRVGEADEDLLQLALLEVVGQVLHAIRAHDRGVVELPQASRTTSHSISNPCGQCADLVVLLLAYLPLLGLVSECTNA